MRRIITPDLVLSYWILLWFVLYYWGFTQYNPKFLLMVGLAENVVMLLLMILYGRRDVFKIAMFVLVNICIKIIPLYLVWNTVVLWIDIYVSVGLVVAYCIWVYLRLGKSFYEVQRNIVKALLGDEFETPIMSVAYKIREYLLR